MGIGAQGATRKALREALQGRSSAIADAGTLFSESISSDGSSRTWWTCWPKVRTPGPDAYCASIDWRGENEPQDAECTGLLIDEGAGVSVMVCGGEEWEVLDELMSSH